MGSSERTDQTATAAAQGAPAASAAPTAAPTTTTAGTAAAAEATRERLGLGTGQREKGFGGPAAAPSRSEAAASSVDGARISCLMNAQYHSAREAFLDTLHRWFMFSVIVLGAGALIDLLPILRVGTKELFAASSAIIAALDLTFDLSNRARAHAMQKRRYFELLSQLNSGEKSPEQVRVCIDQYSADEEPQYKVLIFACWNAAQLTIYGNDAHRIQIPVISGWFKNWLRRPSAYYDIVVRPHE
jgi:hypothetical protein